MGCPLQPDLVNTSCSVDCAPDAVLALWEGGLSDPRTGVYAVLPLSELPTHEHLHPSQFRDARQSWLLNQGTRPLFLNSAAAFLFMPFTLSRHFPLMCRRSLSDSASLREIALVLALLECLPWRSLRLDARGNAMRCLEKGGEIDGLSLRSSTLHGALRIWPLMHKPFSRPFVALTQAAKTRREATTDHEKGGGNENHRAIDSVG